MDIRASAPFIEPLHVAYLERPDGAGVVLARVNRDELRRLRERFPSLSHRRLGHSEVKGGRGAD